MDSNIFSLTLAVFFLVSFGTGCAPGNRDQDKTYSLSLSEPDDRTDVTVIDWKKCEFGENTGCIRGYVNSEPYRFGFNGDPNKLVGVIGTKKIELQLNPNRVESFGNGILELPFTSTKEDMFIIVNWNSKKQKLIGHDISVTE